MKYAVGQTVILVSDRDPNKDPVLEATITRVGRKYAHASARGRPFILNETEANEGEKWSGIGYRYSHWVYPSWEEFRVARARSTFKSALQNHRKLPALSMEEMVDIAARLGMPWAPETAKNNP